jgi:hypothetical protein
MTTYRCWDEFYAADPSRRVPVWDFGNNWNEDGARFLICWVPSTRETIATPAWEPNGTVEVLGVVDDPELVHALLLGPETVRSLSWARAVIGAAPTDPLVAAEAIAGTEAWHAARADAEGRARRELYRVVRVEDLPDPDRELGLAARPCGCRDCMAGAWEAVAEAAVALLEGGMDPLNLEEVSRAAGVMLSDVRDRKLLVDLFRSPIELRPGGYVNGRHRAHALRRAGVARCVVVHHRSDPP